MASGWYPHLPVSGAGCSGVYWLTPSGSIAGPRPTGSVGCPWVSGLRGRSSVCSDIASSQQGLDVGGVVGPGSSLLFMHMLVVADVSLLFSFIFSASVEADSQCLFLLTFSPASHSYLFFLFCPSIFSVVAVITQNLKKSS